MAQHLTSNRRLTAPKSHALRKAGPTHALRKAGPKRCLPGSPPTEKDCAGEYICEWSLALHGTDVSFISHWFG
ncbi:hypothetical protein [Anthocerotibacter panamensis]|uniref:hypothetical protein n=1 Tax=Anthocerotibacter panamensis TaxID=2857077 RepID=UPI001C4058B0|nr:hypothetical protein [Anthocerotibacter panamensis]